MKRAGRICIMLLCMCLFSLIAMGCGESGSTVTVSDDDFTGSAQMNTSDLSEVEITQSTSDVSTEETDPVEQTSSDEEVVVTVTGKTNIEADIYSGRYSDRVAFEIQITNQTDKTIKGVQGVHTVDDLFGKKIMSSNCDFTGQKIPAGESVTFTDKYLEINEYDKNKVKIYNEEYADLLFNYEVTDIVYDE